MPTAARRRAGRYTDPSGIFQHIATNVGDLHANAQRQRMLSLSAGTPRTPHIMSPTVPATWAVQHERASSGMRTVFKSDSTRDQIMGGRMGTHAVSPVCACGDDGTGEGGAPPRAALTDPGGCGQSGASSAVSSTSRRRHTAQQRCLRHGWAGSALTRKERAWCSMRTASATGRSSVAEAVIAVSTSVDGLQGRRVMFLATAYRRVPWRERLSISPDRRGLECGRTPPAVTLTASPNGEVNILLAGLVAVCSQQKQPSDPRDAC